MKINYYLLIIFWGQPNSNNKQQTQPPTKIDQNCYCWKLAPISAFGNMLQVVIPIKCIVLLYYCFEVNRKKLQRYDVYQTCKYKKQNQNTTTLFGLWSIAIRVKKYKFFTIFGVDKHSAEYFSSMIIDEN